MAGRRTDLASGGAGLALSLGVCYGARAMPMGAVRDPGAGFLPFWIGVTLAAMSVALVVGAVLDRERGAAGTVEGLQRRQVAWIVAALVGYALALDALGFLLTTFILLGVLLRILGERGWGTVLGFATLATAGSWALFGLWLGVPLPGGILAP
jgi:hypothetical protein